jgi:hypothetical protein
MLTRAQGTPPGRALRPRESVGDYRCTCGRRLATTVASTVLRAATAIPIALAALELSHPAWADGSIAQAVNAAGGWWLPLHVLLIAGYGVLALVLWRRLSARVGPVARAARSLALVFGACNSAYLAIDGIGVGVLAQTDPNAANALWNSPLVAVLADATGASWAAALLLAALTLAPPAPRVEGVGAVLTWLLFTASAAPFPAAALLSRLAALATGAWAVYQRGTIGIPFALLAFAAVLRQHVGPEAALGLGCISLAFALTTRSAPAASCPP